jgi:hypothetical protein
VPFFVAAPKTARQRADYRCRSPALLLDCPNRCRTVSVEAV